MLATLSQIPDKVWLFVVLLALVAVFAYRPDATIQKWIEYVLIALIAVLRNGAQTTVVVGEPQASAMTSKIAESLTSKNG
jgi:hypothetical protein